MGAARQPERADLVAHDGDRRHAQVLDIHSYRQQARHQRPVDHAGGLVVIAARDHDLPPAHDGPARSAELGREFGRDLDVGEPRHAVAPEERPAPALAPDEAHGQRGAVLDLLVRPDFHVGLDDTALAYSTKSAMTTPSARNAFARTTLLRPITASLT